MTGSTIADIAAKVAAGGRVDAAEALLLYREAPTQLLGRLADGIRRRKHPSNVVTYIIDRNVNYTNVCVARCNFCAFYREVGAADGYVLGFEEIFRKIDETIAVGGNQLLLQGGHNPDLPLAWYEDLFRAIKSRYPTFKLHALSPPEVLHISRLGSMSTAAVIDRLIAAGLDSIPGGGAEMLVDRVRKILNCYSKASSDEWLGVMREAHLAGLRTTATMMYGTVETDEERIEHMMRLRTLQDETGGFTAFITWSYQPEHTEHGGYELTGVDYLRTLALARILLDNIDNLQASWVTQGGKVGQLSLAFGANDMGSVMIEENVVRAAGAAYCMDEVEIVGNVEDAGYQPMRRNMHYDVLGEPVFRNQNVPRMLSLATARADGDQSVPDELKKYLRGAEPASSSGLPTSTTFTADWVLPIAQPPIARGHVSCAGGHIVDVGTGHAGGIDLGRVALMPALVNAHTHLELSYLRGRVGPAPSFVEWVRVLLALRREAPDPQADHIVAAAARACGEAVSSGTGVFGDVSNTLVTPLLGARAPRVSGIVFQEVLGFRAEAAAALITGARERAQANRTDGVRINVAPHAPYSVSPALFRAIAAELQRDGSPITTVHLAEAPEEVQLLRDGSGPWRQILEGLGAWDETWRAPGLSPVAYMESLGFLGRSVLVAHAVQCDAADVARLEKSGAAVVVCPRSNHHVGVGSAPIEAFYRAGLRVAIGTDSLASAPNLNLFEEMAHVRRLAPSVAARQILESATRVGAEALGCGDRHGAIAPGMAPGLIAVSVPGDVVDVEEYLVSGIEPERVSWVWHPRHDAASA